MLTPEQSAFAYFGRREIEADALSLRELRLSSLAFTEGHICNV